MFGRDTVVVFSPQARDGTAVIDSAKLVSLERSTLLQTATQTTFSRSSRIPGRHWGYWGSRVDENTFERERF